MILGIYGAGGLGREVYELALRVNSEEKRWSEIIFIDDSEFVDSLRPIDIFSFSTVLQEVNLDNLEVCVAIGEPSIRESIFRKITDHKIKIATLIHPETTIAESTKIGEGTIICKFVSITCDIIIGKNVYIHPMACIGHDSLIGDHSVISSFVDVAGNCEVQTKSFLAIGVILKQGIKIGKNCIVGMSSVVHRDLPESVIALGNPARPMKKNEKNKVFR